MDDCGAVQGAHPEICHSGSPRKTWHTHGHRLPNPPHTGQAQQARPGDSTMSDRDRAEDRRHPSPHAGRWFPSSCTSARAPAPQRGSVITCTVLGSDAPLGPSHFLGLLTHGPAAVHPPTGNTPASEPLHTSAAPHPGGEVPAQPLLFTFLSCNGD